MVNHYVIHQSATGAVLVKAYSDEAGRSLMFSANVISPDHLLNLVKTLPAAPVEVRKAHGNNLSEMADAIEAMGRAVYRDE